MKSSQMFVLGVASSALVLGGIFAFAQEKPAAPKPAEAKPAPAQATGESERKVKEGDVPKAALEALKKYSENAKFTEFAEEIEHSQKYYEGSYKGPNGNVDVLVTEAGDLVEIEESVAADKVPAGVRAAAEKAAGKDNKVSFEKKTVVMYEIHFKKDGKGHEAIFTPDGRSYHEEGSENGEKDEDDKD